MSLFKILINKYWLFLCLGSLFCCFSEPAIQDVQPDLNRVLEVLHHLEQLIEEASRDTRQSNHRITFHFDALLSDIQSIQQGIQSYLDYPKMIFIPPIEGDYIHWTGGLMNE